MTDGHYLVERDPSPDERSRAVGHYAPSYEVDWSNQGPAEPQPTSLKALIASMLRYRALILVAAVLGVGGAYVAWGMYVPMYDADGTIWVQGNNDEANLGPVQTGELLPAQSWMDLLETFALLEPVVVQQRLYVEPLLAEDIGLFEQVEIVGDLGRGEYQLSAEGGSLVLSRAETQIDRAPLGQPIGEPIGIAWTAPSEVLELGRPVAFSVRSVREAAGLLNQDLNTQMDQTGSFITLSLADRDPVRAAATLNSVMDRQVELAADLKGASLDEQYDIIQEQLAYTQSELAEAERALESFRVQTITLPSDRPIQGGLEMTRDPVFEEFFQMRVQQEEVRRDIRRLEEAAAAVSTSGLRIEAIELVPSVTSSSQLQEAIGALVTARAERTALLERYTEEHPLVLETTARITTLEQQRIPTLMSQLVQQLRTEEEVLAEQIRGSGTDLTQIPPRAIEEARLARNVTVAEQSYLNLQDRFQTANLAMRSSPPDLRILDRATPPETSVELIERATVPAMVFAGFLGVGLGLALLFAKLDSRLRTPDQISAAFGLTILGAIPRIERGGGRKSSQDIRNLGQVYEAFREVRTNLLYAYGSAGPIVLTISSPGMGEGKTTISTNLGIAFAELGKRTLLVDADTRRGDMHHYLDGRRKPGLTDYLRMKASGEEVLQGTSHQGLDFIGSGTQVANSPELLSSSEMGRMMAALKKDYDVIIVDSPPLGAGADPLVLATITGHMMIVVRSGSTDREFTQVKLEPLSRLPVRVLGMVMNDYEPSRIGDGYQHYGNYLPGYEAGQEDEDEEPGRALPAAVSASAAGDAPGRFGKEQA
jgi:succinoglycan biosynthesis transport protein ExoP